VDADLGETVGTWFLAPAPDLGSVDVDEVGAAAHGTLFCQVDRASGRGVVDQDGAVAVGKTTY